MDLPAECYAKTTTMKHKPEMTPAEEQELREHPINLYTCGHPDCKKNDSMVFEEFKHHLFKDHNLKADQLKGKKQLKMHMDGEQWYSYNYEWTLDSGLTFYQFTKQARALNDPMRFY